MGFYSKIWINYQNEAKLTFELFFKSLLEGKKWNLFFFRQLFGFMSILKKKLCWKLKIKSWSYIPYPFSYIFPCESFCSIKTDWVLFFLIYLILKKKNWKLRKTPQSLDKINLWLPIIHAYTRFLGGSHVGRVKIFWYVINQTLKITFRQKEKTQHFDPSLSSGPLNEEKYL